ncbi:MAG: formate acetyltransferase [Clostridia bacterium]|nr:formate acetyltransferase [Clostridia bacterium]
MSEICFVNTYPADKRYTYDERIALLRARKVAQTAEKAKKGGADEDDYGLIEQDVFHFELEPNHENGSIYGYEAWTKNYVRLLAEHPLYCDPLDAFVGKGFLFMERLRPKAHKWNPAYPYDDLKVIFDRYNIISGIDNCHHFTPDLEIGLALGWGGILEKLEREKARHDAGHRAFYDAEIAVVRGIIAFLERCAGELLELSRREKNPQLAENLREMARVNARVARGKPETFREAVQWMCWFSMLSRTYNRGSAGGQLDEMLRPYYEKDTAAGRLTDGEAVFYLACLFLQDSRYFQLGGPDENGEDLTSHLSFLALEAADKINIACNLTVRVHDKLSEDFFRKSVEYLFKNRQGWPRYSSDKALTEGFMRCGYPIELARRRVAAGCHWMCIPGMEYTMNDTVKINLAKVFEVAWREMMTDGGAPSVERLFELFGKHLKTAVDATGRGIMHHLRYQTQSQPELILNLFQHGLIEKGVNITDGGANFYDMCVDGSGIAVVADSFAALEQRVEEEKKLTFEGVFAHTEADFQGAEGEAVRALLYRSRRFGGGETRGDAWAVRVKDLFVGLVRDLCRQHPGIQFIPGFFSWSNTILLGKAVGATPNGRRAGEPINHGANPCSGFRPDGAVSAMCNSIAAIQPGYGNTAPVQLEVDPGAVRDREGVEKMAAMIRAILDTGNTLLNINIIDAEKILAAHRDPSLYPDLVVRVTGFTAYFAMLSPAFRQLVVDRVTSVNARQLPEKEKTEKESEVVL